MQAPALLARADVAVRRRRLLSSLGDDDTSEKGGELMICETAVADRTLTRSELLHIKPHIERATHVTHRP